MLLQIARLVNLVLAGMLTGHEFASMVAVYPALGKLPPLQRLQAEQEMYRRNGTIMPFYMSSTLVSFLPVLVLVRAAKSSSFRFTLAGAACFAGMLAITLTRNLPLNSRIVALPVDDASVGEFARLRERWDRLHAARNVLNIAGFVFACLGALTQARSGKGL